MLLSRIAFHFTMSTVDTTIWKVMFSALKETKEKEQMQSLTQVPKTSIVYALHNQTFPHVLKLGTTSKPIQNRISSLGVGVAEHPFVLVDQFKTFDWKDSEKQTHCHFAEFRTKGEFFRVSPMDIADFFQAKRKEFQREALGRMRIVRENRMRITMMGAWKDIIAANKTKKEKLAKVFPSADANSIPVQPSYEDLLQAWKCKEELRKCSEKLSNTLEVENGSLLVLGAELKLILSMVQAYQNEHQLLLESLEKERLFLTDEVHYWRSQTMKMMDWVQKKDNLSSDLQNNKMECGRKRNAQSLEETTAKTQKIVENT